LEIEGEGPGGETSAGSAANSSTGVGAAIYRCPTSDTTAKRQADCNSVPGLADFATSERRYCTAVTQLAHGPCGNASMNAAIYGDISARFPHRVHHAVV